jgi:capsular exopolysaccharide synthesis family protein
MKALPGSTAGFPVPIAEYRPNWLRRFLDVLSRRRLVILRTMVVGVGLTSLACVLMGRRYTATSEIQIQSPSAANAGIEGGGGAPPAAADPNAGSMTLQTTATLLKSPTLAMRVIEGLNLEASAAFQPHFNLTNWLSALFQPAPPKDAPGAGLAASPARRDRLLKEFNEGLEVAIVPGTRVIEVAFSSSDPNLAAAIVNRLVGSLEEYTAQAESSQTSGASKWLEEQLAEAKAQTDALQAKLTQLQKETGVVQVPGDDGAAAHGQVYSSTLDQLQKATTAVSQAHSDLILKGTIYEMVKTGNPETILGLSSDPSLAGAAAGMSGSVATISSLRTKEATLDGQINELLAKFGPAYPKVDELKADRATIEASIQAEIQRMRDRARNEFELAKQIETSAKEQYESQKRQGESMNDKAVQYELVRQQFEQSRDQQAKLEARLKDAGATEAFHSTGIQVVSAALPPSEPSRPNIPLYMGVSLAASLFLGCVMAFVANALDTRISDVRGLEALVGHAPMGVLPAYKTAKASLRLSGYSVAPKAAAVSIAALTEPRSVYVESLRSLRTALLSSNAGAAPQVLLVTSAIEGEGKSTLSANLAVVFAQQGKRVLLVDADLRRPNLHILFHAPCETGLSTLLGGEPPAEGSNGAVLHFEQVPGLDILPAGPVPALSAELLGSGRMKQMLGVWRQHYDVVILDGAPVLPVTDSVVLCPRADLTLLVARHQSTPRQALDASLRTLRAQVGSDRHIGVVVNGVELKSDSYFTSYGSTGYGKSYSTKRLGGSNEVS